VPFPVKALKIIIHDLQSGGDAATISAQGNTVEDVDSDDGVSNSPIHEMFNTAYIWEMLGRRLDGGRKVASRI
jgi:hypothetical protein